jgi:hypothetical protein
VLVQSPGLEFETRTELEVLNGANLLLVGQEIIQFADAEQLGPSDWRLSKLLRGRRGTEWAMSMHQVGEFVLVLDPAALSRVSSLDEVGLASTGQCRSAVIRAWGFSTTRTSMATSRSSRASPRPWTPAMIRRWNADPFGFLCPWNEVSALIGSAPPTTPPSGTGVVVCLMG